LIRGVKVVEKNKNEIRKVKKEMNCCVDPSQEQREKNDDCGSLRKRLSPEVRLSLTDFGWLIIDYE
jgi:hypothetical protein